MGMGSNLFLWMPNTFLMPIAFLVDHPRFAYGSVGEVNPYLNAANYSRENRDRRGVYSLEYHVHPHSFLSTFA